MAKPSLNKSALAKEVAQLGEYRRFLPSLELKRLQITSQRSHTAHEVTRLKSEYDRQFQEISASLPMLANTQVKVEDLVSVSGIKRTEHSLSGTKLPVLNAVIIDRKNYPRQATPHWVDLAARGIEELVRLSIELDVMMDRLLRLERAEAVISRRVNLFDKVLVPQAQANIKKIQMALSDGERDAVVRAKISKRKTAARAADMRVSGL